MTAAAGWCDDGGELGGAMTAASWVVVHKPSYTSIHARILEQSAEMMARDPRGAEPWEFPELYALYQHAHAVWHDLPSTSKLVRFRFKGKTYRFGATLLQRLRVFDAQTGALICQGSVGSA